MKLIIPVTIYGRILWRCKVIEITMVMGAKLVAVGDVPVGPEAIGIEFYEVAAGIGPF